MPVRFDSIAPPLPRDTPVDWIRKNIVRSSGTTGKALRIAQKTSNIFKVQTNQHLSKASIGKPKDPQYLLVADTALQSRKMAPNLPSNSSHSSQMLCCPLPSPRKVRSLAKHEIKREHTDKRAIREQKRSFARTQRRRSSITIPQLEAIGEDGEHTPNYLSGWPLPNVSETFEETAKPDSPIHVERASLEEERPREAMPNQNITWVPQPPVPGKGPLNSHPIRKRDDYASITRKLSLFPQFEQSPVAVDKIGIVSETPTMTAVDEHFAEKAYETYISQSNYNEAVYDVEVVRDVFEHGNLKPSAITRESLEALTNLNPGTEEDNEPSPEQSMEELPHLSGADMSNIDDLLGAATELAPPKPPTYLDQMLTAASHAQGRRKSRSPFDSEQLDVPTGEEMHERKVSLDSINSDNYEGDDATFEILADSLAMKVQAVEVSS